MKFATNFLLVFIALWIGDPDMSAVAQDALPEQGAEAKLFAVEIKVGPGWDNAKTPNEQAYFKEHSANLKRLREEGHIVMGARYSDIGLLIISAETKEAVETMMEQDPSMTAQTFVFAVHEINVFYPGHVQGE